MLFQLSYQKYRKKKFNSFLYLAIVKDEIDTADDHSALAANFLCFLPEFHLAGLAEHLKTA